jgi:DNA-directed RNA polymerase specialized sigma24 family protein
VWILRFALALAALVETNDATDADLLLRARAMAICRRYRMAEDLDEVVQNCWVAILPLIAKHITSPDIAAQAPSIIYRKAVDVIRARERVRQLDALWTESEQANQADAIDDATIEEEIAILLARLRLENPSQCDAIELTLSSLDQEEARTKWEVKSATTITAENFRQMCRRGKRRLRNYRDGSDG